MKAVLPIDLPDELFEDIENWWIEYKLSYINNGEELCTYHSEHERLVPLKEKQNDCLAEIDRLEKIVMGEKE